MNGLKKSAITVVGGTIVFVALVVAILPGTLIFMIPVALVGLVILSREYPQALKVLRKLQRLLSTTAAKLDKWFSKR